MAKGYPLLADFFVGEAIEGRVRSRVTIERASKPDGTCNMVQPCRQRRRETEPLRTRSINSLRRRSTTVLPADLQRELPLTDQTNCRNHLP